MNLRNKNCKNPFQILAICETYNPLKLLHMQKLKVGMIADLYTVDVFTVKATFGCLLMCVNVLLHICDWACENQPCECKLR